uniref:Uncharacterized protein n=1 Tax=Strongyloides venezuelensis TaxID=75913 RepID=A0A0K0FP19_STRVS
MFIQKIKNKWNLLKKKNHPNDSHEEDAKSTRPDLKLNSTFMEVSRNPRTQILSISNTQSGPTSVVSSGQSSNSKKVGKRRYNKPLRLPKKDALVYKGGCVINKPKKLESGLDGTLKKIPKEMTEPFTEFAISKEIKGLKEMYNAEFDNELKITPDQAKAFYDVKNKDKNRNKNVPCLETTRVHLMISDQFGNDYIHANYIPTSKAGDRMIITQAPMNYETNISSSSQPLIMSTATDFFRMIEQEECEFVVMLCSFGDEKETMCCQYIPTNGSTNIGQYKVTTLKREPLPEDNNVILSRIQYIRKDEKKPKEFNHLHYLDWPKEGFPKPWVLTPINIYLRIKDSQKPVIIHCTSGIRRSGTLASIFMALDELDNGTLPKSLVPIVKHIRSYRLMAVRTPVEFLYIHLQLIHYFLHKGYIDNSQRLLSFFDDYDPAYKKQAAREKTTQCVSEYGIKTVKTPLTPQNQQPLSS